MRRLRNKIWVWILGALLLWPIAGSLWMLNPIHRPPLQIREYLLKKTPLGSSFQSVTKMVENEGWLNRNYVGSGGYLVQEPGRASYEVGVSSINGHLGKYGFPLRVHVSAFWGFNEKGELVDIWVWKTVDGL